MKRISLRPPAGRHLSEADTMTPRALAHACWLSFRMGWDLVPENWFYCGESDQVLVQFRPGGTCTWSVVRFDAEQTLALIEERFGADARRAAENASR